MITEYTKHENKENNWTLHEIRTFNKDDRMENAKLLVVDTTTNEYVSDERLEDDVWQFEWESLGMRKYPGKTLEEVLNLVKLTA